MNAPLSLSSHFGAYLIGLVLLACIVLVCIYVRARIVSIAWAQSFQDMIYKVLRELRRNKNTGNTEDTNAKEGP